MPGPDGMKSSLEAMRTDAKQVASDGPVELTTAALSVATAAERFTLFLERYGFDLREFDYSGDTPIDGELNAIIGTMSLDQIREAANRC
jgi:hypothetical protein